MPHRNANDIKELEKSLDQISNLNTNFILTGDYNCPDINWDTMSVNPTAQDREIQRSLLNVVTSHAITQIHETPTRGNNLLIIILTSNPSLIKSSTNAPGISDHDMIITDCEAKPHYQSKRPRECYIHSKANWEALHNELTNLSTNIKEMYQKGVTVQDLWNSFKKELFASLDKYITKQGYVNKQRKQKYGNISGTSKRNAKDKSGKPNGPTSTINNGGTRDQQSEAVLEIY